MQPREESASTGMRSHAEGGVRVIVAGATGASGGANAAAMLSGALSQVGFERGVVDVVHSGAMLEGLLAASAAGAWRFVVVTGGSAVMLTSAFAMVKAIESRQPGARIEVLVTGQDESRAHASYQRVRAAAERFLGRDVGFAGAFTDMDAAPADESDGVDSTGRRATRAARAARMWAARLLAECSDRAWPEAAHSMN